jgi:FtsP/CotA-like multicopper oxidase with cupredoxin domain
MKKLLILTSFICLLTSCQSEKEHTQMKETITHQMDHGDHEHGDMEGFLPGKDVRISDLPEAKPSEVIEVEDGDVIELNPMFVKKAIKGQQYIVMYGYNGQIPGPMIRATQGATITVNVKNNIDMPTTIHWHGVRLDNENDGVPDVTQEVIQPDGTFTYTVKLPDEGIYWYHPHVREDIQQDMGLYGNVLVAPENDAAYSTVHREEVLVLDDINIDDLGFALPYGKDDATHSLMGRFGNTILVNGMPTTRWDWYQREVPRGTIIRFYITNVSNTRTFNIVIPGPETDAPVKRPVMKLVGSDVGRYEKQKVITSLTIAPAERYIVDVLFEVGSNIEHRSPTGKDYFLGLIRTSNEEADPILRDTFYDMQSHDDVIADIDPFRKHFDKPIDKILHLSVNWSMAHDMRHDENNEGIEWEDTMPEMNAASNKENTEWKLIDKRTGAENMDINWTFEKGSVVKMRIVNDGGSDHPMHHPMHFHGQRFLVLSMDGKKNDNLVWKDTVLIPSGSMVDLLFDMSNPGEWMFHCHIAEHLTNGMMGIMKVIPKEEPPI